MKTLLRRLSLAAAGFALALGVGVAIGSASKVVETQAEGMEFTFNHYSGEITEGDYIIYYNGKAMKSVIESNRFGYEAITPEDDSVVSNNADIVWHIAPSITEGYWTLYSNSALKYAAGNGVANQGGLLDDGTDNKAKWTVSGNSTYEFVNLHNSGAEVNSNLRNNGSNGFACYSTKTGGALSLYKRFVYVSDATKMVARVSAINGEDAWHVSNLKVFGTLNGIAEADITDYVSVVPTTAVPIGETDATTVTFSVTRKPGVLGNSNLGSLSVSDGKVSSQKFPHFDLVTDLGQIESGAIYALGSVAKDAFANGIVESKIMNTVTDDGETGLFHLETGASPGKYYLRFVKGNCAPYELGKYLAASGLELSESANAAGATEWEPIPNSDKFYLKNSEGRYLAASETTIKAYLSGTKNLFLHAFEADELEGITLSSQQTAFASEDTFEFGGSITATYSKSGTFGHHIDANDSGITYEIKNFGSDSFNPLEEGDSLSVANDSATIRVTYSDPLGDAEFAEYVISVGNDAITRIELNKTSGTLYVGVSGKDTDAVSVSAYSKVGEAAEGVTWSSSDEDVARVVGGVVTAVGAGVASIVARSITTPSTYAVYTATVLDESVVSFTWSNRGSVDCFEGTPISDALKYTDWRFDGSFLSGAGFTATTWESVGTEAEDIHIGLYDTPNPSSEGASLSLDYQFTASDNGKYLVAFYYGTRTSENTVVIVTPKLKSITADPTYKTTTPDLFINANITKKGTSGGTGPNPSASANRYGFSVSSTKAYFSNSDWRLYNGSSLTIASTEGKLIDSITFSFAKGYQGGLNTSYSSLNSTEFTVDPSEQARITGLNITYIETSLTNTRLAAQKAVIQFANSMNSIMAVPGVCGTEGNYGHDDPSTFQTAWSSVKAQYTTIIGALAGDDLAAAEGMFAHAEAKWDDNPDCLQRAMKTYDFVLSHYASELVGIAGYEFLSGIREPAGAARVNSPYVANESLNPVILVALLGGLSVALVGGYFFLRRRKENE